MEFLDLIPNVCEGLPFEEGDFVLLNFWGDNEDLKILDIISEHLSKKGVLPFKHQCSNWFFEKVALNLIQNDPGLTKEYIKYLSTFKNVVDIFMYPPSLPNRITEDEIPKLKNYLGKLFNALSDDKKYYIQLNVPTEVNATKAGLDYHTYLSAMCQALSVDFPRLKKACQDKVESLKDKTHIEIITGDRYSLKLDVSNRKWYVDDGCGDFPPGEVYIAPVETNSHGDLLVPTVNFKGETYKDVVMTFENGKLLKTSSKELNDFFSSLPDNFKILCEFGIGLNPQVKELIGYTPIDEKALGTYHIALGMNHFFGGENKCPFHMDFVFTCDEVIYN